MKTKLWIARYKNGVLLLFERFPNSNFHGDFFSEHGGCIRLDNDSHPEIIFENSLQQIEI